MAVEQGTGAGKKIESCQMIFALSNDLEGGEEPLELLRAVSADVPESLLHIHYLSFPRPHMAGF